MMKIGIKYLVYSILVAFLYFILSTVYLVSTVHAIVDPLSSPNNKFGIHIISATPDESSPAASLVNTNGDWGYITFLIESKDRNEGKWQEFFNDLRRRHLIPIVRLTTKPVNEHWERPYEGEEEAWADFLDKLNWPVKNRYITVYNELNHGSEWGLTVDPTSYAKVLDKTIDALKKKSADFFVMNGGFDASAPQQPPRYFDEGTFLSEMEKSVPGIFEKLDGWVSHSYPQPEFVGSPNAVGRGTIRTYVWELQVLRNLGVTKNLPVFITETGWKHAEGLSYNPNFPTSETVANNYELAFENAWSAERIVAVTPFLLDYQEIPFDHFSFKKVSAKGGPASGWNSTDYYPAFQTIKDLPKISGRPIQDNLAKLTKGEVYSSIVAGQSYTINLAFGNVGQSIWNDPAPGGAGQVTKLVALEGGKELGISDVEIPKDIKVEPGQEYIFSVNLKAPQKGIFRVKLNLFTGKVQFQSSPIEFITEVKLPVILQVLGNLKWKNNSAGDYVLRVSGVVGDLSQKVTLDSNGKSPEIEAKYLLPNYNFEFSLEKPYYKAKTIQKTLQSGENILDFGQLQPDILSVLLKPKELWMLLPFSN